MKSDQEIMQSIRAAIDDCTKGIDNAPSLQYQIARKAKGEEPVVKKISTTVVLVIVLLAITVVALAAGSLIFGWVDFYKDGYNVDVPDAARQVMTNNDQDIVTLGPATFTVREKYIDPWTALTSTVITLNNSSNALLTGEDPFDAIGANGENGRAVAQRLGVGPMTTWAEAAKKLNLTLYSVSAELEVPEELSDGEVMGDVMFNEDGSVTYFCMPLLNGTAKGDSVDCQIYLRVLEVNVDDSENQPDARTISQPINIPLQMPSETHTYEVTQEYPAAGLTLTGVRAELTPAGVYLFADFIAREGMTRDDFYDNGQWAPVLYSADGKRYGGGLNLSIYEETENWPQLTLMRLHSMDSIPDTMIFVLEYDLEEPEAALATQVILKK